MPGVPIPGFITLSSAIRLRFFSMRAALERSLNKTWYGKRQPGALLLLLERVYRLLSSLHRRYNYLRRARDLEGAPIVVVGNLTTGGAGKTPLVIRLCKIAQSAGLQPAVISRGYGRRSRQPLSVTADMDPRDGSVLRANYSKMKSI